MEREEAQELQSLLFAAVCVLGGEAGGGELGGKDIHQNLLVTSIATGVVKGRNAAGIIRRTLFQRKKRKSANKER